MKHGFIKAASSVPEIKVADVNFNSLQIRNLIKRAHEECVHVLVFPKLCVTGSTCQDLFLQNSLIAGAREAVKDIAFSVPRNMVAIYSAPIMFNGKLYACSIVASDGKILAVVPDNNLSDSERRYFHSYEEETKCIDFEDYSTSFSASVLFKCNQLPLLRISCTGSNNATVVAISDSKMSSAGFLKNKTEETKATAGLFKTGIIYANASSSESTSDGVFSSDCILCELSEVLKVSSFEENRIISTEFDLEKIEFEKRSLNVKCEEEKTEIFFDMEIGDTVLTREIPTSPFIPQEIEDQNELAYQVMQIQSKGLQKRITHTNSKTAVLGISGGLDSTLALLVTVNAFDSLKLDRKDIICITMPCFGTTQRTKTNAEILVEKLGCTLRTIDIAASVKQHFEDIGHNGEIYDAAYENSQARERTQILMDVANMENGLVVGTGDLSELALGWATYNGDHMSNYGVNAGVPKTLVRLLVRYTADSSDNEILRDTLYSILDTPISPELVPGKQETEDLVGPYDLHDFFIYYYLRYGFSLSKILRLAQYAFDDIYDRETILKWLKVFCRRFFTQQFKRSCLPDGPAVLDISLSPRTGFKMPSDSSFNVWIEELEESLNE